jgi:hypothetical protein
MFRSISATNGGIVVQLVIAPPEQPIRNVDGDSHLFGYILDVGNGVPWLKPEDHVAFLAADATPVICPDGTIVYLLDQRAVQAKLFAGDREGTMQLSNGPVPVGGGSRSPV